MNRSNSVLGQNVCRCSWLAGYICWNDMVWQCVSMFVSEWPGCPVNLQSLESITLKIKYSSSLTLWVRILSHLDCCKDWTFTLHHGDILRVCVVTNSDNMADCFNYLANLLKSFVATCMNLVQGDWLSWKSSLFSTIDLWESAWHRRTSRIRKCTLPWFNGR